MPETTLKIALAGLMHDIGKFAERAYAVEPGDKDSVWQDYRYGHAYITEKVLQDIFPGILEQKIDNPDGINDFTILNLAARHHKPRHAYELMIAEGDRIASGHERAKADHDADFKTEGRERKSQVPLLSILGRVRLDENSGDSVMDRRYRITPSPLRHAPGFEQGFPLLPEEYSADQVRKGYAAQWNKFKEAITKIDPLHQFETFLELCRMYQWCLPASTRKEELPDVSLFEHQKATAALASCLYLYHSQGNNFDETAICNRDKRKYFLFCGDISGIQNFIYQISSKGAYKTLKGRSFFIQLLAEIVARKFIAAFGLTPANILYASGGKFYLLLPKIEDAAERLTMLGSEINLELRQKYDGDLFIRTGFVSLCGNDLTGAKGRNLSTIWDELGHKLVFEDRARYATLARDHYELIFGVSDAGEYVSCVVCHRSMPKTGENDEGQCLPCRKMLEIGRKLGSSRYLVMARDKGAMDGRYHIRIFDYYFWFLEGSRGLFPHKDCLVWSFNDPDFVDLAAANSLSTINAVPMVVGSTHSFDQEFEEIAQTSNGVSQLGILRMDVDNLGRIFSHGLRNYHYNDRRNPGRFHSLGRITTLSWQLSLFFGAMVPALIQSEEPWHDRVTVVYSGGDDLFILGAWDAIPQVALAVRKAFERFCCGNPTWGLSGGMILSGGKFPIYKSAELAGTAEEKAKKLSLRKRGGTIRTKNAFTCFDTTMAWEEFEQASGIHDKLIPTMKEKKNRPLLSRLRDISASWASSRDRLFRSPRILSMETIKHDLEAEKWRWRMVYSLKRLSERRESLTGVIEEVQQFIINPTSYYDRWGIELLGVISRWCELELRKPANNKGGD